MDNTDFFGPLVREESLQNSLSISQIDHEDKAIVENIARSRSFVNDMKIIRNDMRTVADECALLWQEWQQYQEAKSNTAQFQLSQHYQGWEQQFQYQLHNLQCRLAENKERYETCTQKFNTIRQSNIENLGILERLIILTKLGRWKCEQQKMQNKIVDENGLLAIVHSTSLDQIQAWCGELADLIKMSYELQLEVDNMVSRRTGNTGPSICESDIHKLLERLIFQTFIVEKQPPQILKVKTRFSNQVIVTHLVGKQLGIYITDKVSAKLISKDEIRNLSFFTDLNEDEFNAKKCGRIKNQNETNEIESDKDDLVNSDQPIGELNGRLKATFSNLYLKGRKLNETTKDKSGNDTTKMKVMEEKKCLLFTCNATLGTMKFKISTLSLPVTITAHSSQEALAMAAISWDHAFADQERAPFEVPELARWEDVAKVLNAKFYDFHNKGLTVEHLTFLAQKAFRNKKPGEFISWRRLYKENLPDQKFTFWDWFHAALKLVSQKGIWKNDLIFGFIGRDEAENRIRKLPVGTFMLRFSESVPGTISVVVHEKQNVVASTEQTQNFVETLKDLSVAKVLYTPKALIPKDEAFKVFYETKNKELGTVNGTQKKPYRPFIRVLSSSAQPEVYQDGPFVEQQGILQERLVIPEEGFFDFPNMPSFDQ